MPTTSQNNELPPYSQEPSAILHIEKLNDKSTMPKAEKLLWLDLLRGITAFAVFIGHLRTLYFVDYANIQPNKMAQFFYFLTGFGHQAVIIFFVLSGFFIAKTMQSAIDKKVWRFKDYFINRVVRLETVLIPALILGFFWDSIGMKFLFYLESYSGKIPSLPFVSPVGKLNLETFLGNVFFVQNILTYSFGSNSPLWSLANEFWYYMLFPLLYFTFVKKYSPLRRVLFLLIAIYIFTFIGNSISFYFIVWLLGAAAFYVSQKFQQNFQDFKITKIGKAPFISLTLFQSLVIVSVMLFLIIISLARLSILPNYFDDYLLGFISAILTLLLSMSSMTSSKLQKSAAYLSNISYTLYLTHVPVALLLCGFISNERHDWNFENLWLFFALTSIILLYSTACWYFFERNTPIVKNFVVRCSLLFVRLRTISTKQ